MGKYEIIDEPSPRFLENFILNPLIILFASILIPLFIQVPFYGRWWMPFVWLIFNSYILGSPTLKKEILYAVIGVLVVFGLFYLMIYLINLNTGFTLAIVPYFRIVMFGSMFLFVYLIVFLQSKPYEIYEYVKG